jgi:O-antigen/teichoic acid export membrane protein
MRPGGTPLLNGWRRPGKTFAGSGLLSSIGANVAGQAAMAVAQLAVVPAFALHWGTARYGVWLMLFTLPSYLLMADLGLTSAAANDITAAVARGEREAAAASFRAMRGAVRAVAGAVALLALLLPRAMPALLAPIAAATGNEAAAVVTAIGLYGALGLLNGTAAAGLRATGGYALSGYLIAAGFLAEAATALGLLAGSAGMAPLAIGYLAVRAAASLLLQVALHRRAPWLARAPRGRMAPEWRRLARPALAVAALPLAQAASLQGTVLAIGLAAGTGAVPAFTALRTLSRVAVQAILLVNHAVLPAVTTAWATGNRARLATLVTLSHRATLLCAAPGALLLLAAGRPLVERWTGGALHPSMALVAAMAGVTLLNALWQPASNLLVALNRQEDFAWLYAGVAVAALALAVPLAAWAGAAGAALALLSGDAILLARIVRLSRSLGLPGFRTAVRGAARPEGTGPAPTR